MSAAINTIAFMHRSLSYFLRFLNASSPRGGLRHIGFGLVGANFTEELKMASSQQYHQVGGFGATSWQTKVEDIAQTHWRAGGIDLIFGVKPSGATYLYRPDDQPNTSNYAASRNPGRPRQTTSSTQLLSVSPVTFTTYEEFLAFLKDHAHKSAGKRNNQDNSKANKGLDSDPQSRGIPTELGMIRALFEKQRIFLRAYTNTLRPSSTVYAIAPSPKISETRFVSFTYTLWERERQRPLIMDLGWAEFELNEGDNGFQLKSCHHITTKEHSHLRNPGVKVQDFAYGTTERLSLEEAGARFGHFLSASPVPTIIFTHESSRFRFKPRDIIHQLDIETVTWETSLESLDNLLQPATASSVYGVNKSSRYSESQHGVSNASTHKASFHLVDLRNLAVKAVRFVETQDDTLQGNAAYLGVKGVITGGNAGNDAWTLGHMWYAMASGGTFLQQKASMDKAPSVASSTTATPAPEPEQLLGYPNDDSDEEQDPNDVAPMASAAPVTKAMARDPYEALNDDDDDYDVDAGGDSDSDSD
ncbi:hypothetical protein QCA50_003552 [Cerrena zonata]|uniref:Uncharacterized protein n=1 Tax=Cerrena zonata TaxID=2478898 RepID=A0AAW0GPZ0_9APHY